MFFRSENLKSFFSNYPIVSLIIITNLVFWFVTSFPIFPEKVIFETLAGVNLYIVEGEYWRLITPIFLHSGFAHLLFNSFSLVLFGPALESRLGPSKFIIIYLTTGLLANLATLLIEPLTYTHVGSSGAIFGIFGFYISLIIFQHYAFSQRNAQMLIVITFVAVMMTFIEPNINVTAHIFGLIAGFGLGYMLHGRNQAASFTHFKWIRSLKLSSNRPDLTPKQKVFWGFIIVLAIVGFIGGR